MIAGPLTTRLLADLGAEVIKVESLARVDRIREVGVQPPGLLSPDTNGVFNDCNPNKLSITLNLGDPRGIQLAKQLVSHGDVVTSNFTPDRMARWGLGYDDLKAVKEDIIVASLPVMGSEGSRGSWRAVGNGVIALGGLNALTGFPGRPPVGLGTLHSDFTAPYFGALQIAAAIRHRNRTGQGQYIELSQYESCIHLLDTEVLDYLINGRAATQRGNRSAEYVPHGVFPCAGEDRWIAIVARDEAEWLALCEVLELGELAQRADLAEVEGRRRAIDEIEHAITARTRTADAWTLSDNLQRAGVPASPVEDVGDLVGRDPMREGFLQEIDHPSGVSMLVQNEPIVWNGDRLPIRRAPLFGEHTEQIYGQLLGMGSDEVAELVADGVIY